MRHRHSPTVSCRSMCCPTSFLVASRGVKSTLDNLLSVPAQLQASHSLLFSPEGKSVEALAGAHPSLDRSLFR